MDITSDEPTDIEETFVKYHDALRGELNDANWHFTVWKYLRELVGAHRRELSQAPAFFNLTMHAHLLAALVRINKFFDRKEEHLSIRKFLDFVEEHLDIFSSEAFEARMRREGRYDSHIIKEHREITLQTVEEDRKKVNDLPVAHIRRWRNAVLVHIEKERIVRTINTTREYPVEEGQIDDIINTLDEMLNEYLVAYKYSSWAKDLAVKDGMTAVVDAIRFKLTETRRQRYT